jgi:hypothetical protein
MSALLESYEQPCWRQRVKWVVEKLLIVPDNQKESGSMPRNELKLMSITSPDAFRPRLYIQFRWNPEVVVKVNSLWL